MIKTILTDKLHEECGVFGIYRADSANKSVVAETYHALYALAAPRSGELRHCRSNDDGVIDRRTRTTDW